jgi:hypothetical protein
LNGKAKKIACVKYEKTTKYYISEDKLQEAASIEQ